MAEFKQLKKPFSKYEVSETNLVRDVKKKNLITKDKGGKTIRLTDTDGNRKSIKIEDLQGMIDNQETEAPSKVVKTEKAPKVEKVVKEKVAKEPKVKKEPKPKKEKVVKPVFEPTTEMNKIVAGEGSKSSKMQPLLDAGCTVAQTASLLGTHYSYVYNKTNGYYESTKEK